jgi:hypothetical protein
MIKLSADTIAPPTYQGPGLAGGGRVGGGGAGGTKPHTAGVMVRPQMAAATAIALRLTVAPQNLEGVSNGSNRTAVKRTADFVTDNRMSRNAARRLQALHAVVRLLPPWADEAGEIALCDHLQPAVQRQPKRLP